MQTIYWQYSWLSDYCAIFLCVCYIIFLETKIFYGGKSQRYLTKDSLIINTNHSPRKLASITKFFRATINRIKQTDEKLEVSPRRKGKCGRKNITTSRNMLQIRNRSVSIMVWSIISSQGTNIVEERMRPDQYLILLQTKG